MQVFSAKGEVKNAYLKRLLGTSVRFDRQHDEITSVRFDRQHDEITSVRFDGMGISCMVAHSITVGPCGVM